MISYNMTAKQILQQEYEPMNKKLIDLLIDNDIEWPEDAEGVVQDDDGEVKFYAGEKPTIITDGIWHRDVQIPRTVFIEVASDYETAIITKEYWENCKMNKKAMFADIKVGDSVWDIAQGWGVVSELAEDSAYPICADFGYGYSSYTRDGYQSRDNINPSLFWGEIEIKAPPKPLPNLEVDTKVWVWGNERERLPRHFSHFDEDGVLHTFDKGESSFTSCGATSGWNSWKLVE